MSGRGDRIVDQSLWGEARFGGTNIIRHELDGGESFTLGRAARGAREAFAALVRALPPQSSRS